jgi:hypothetical protein
MRKESRVVCGLKQFNRIPDVDRDAYSCPEVCERGGLDMLTYSLVTSLKAIKYLPRVASANFAAMDSTLTFPDDWAMSKGCFSAAKRDVVVYRQLFWHSDWVIGW